MTQWTTKQNIRKDSVYAKQSPDKKDFLSIEIQIEKGLALSDGNAEFYKDKAYSSKNTERPDLQKLKADIEADKIKRIIVYHLDHISRNMADYYDALCLSQM